VNVGTVGHVDHGKTTLTAAITKAGCVSHSVDSMLARFLNYQYGLNVFCFVPTGAG
jgi:translation elongation factor EF-Tu-like GTPase